MHARSSVIALVLALALAPSADAVDGFDLPGSDYANFNARSQQVCRNTCGGDSRCQAWTWVKPGIQGPQGRCWLKHRVPPLVRNDCCSSGPGTYISQSDMKAEGRIDRPGLDYRNFEIGSWQSCQAHCAGEPRCSAWTYVRPGIQGPSARCWLKGQVPYPVDNPNTISGVKYRPRSIRLAEPVGIPADD